MGLNTKFGKFVHQLWHEEDGPTAVEYAVMLAFILAVCVASVNTLAGSLRENFDKSADAIVNAGP